MELKKDYNEYTTRQKKTIKTYKSHVKTYILNFSNKEDLKYFEELIKERRQVLKKDEKN